MIVVVLLALLPCSSDALLFPTTRFSSSKPVTGCERATVMEKGPVTGVPASLVMATVGDVVSYRYRRLGAMLLGSRLSVAPEPEPPCGGAALRG